MEYIQERLIDNQIPVLNKKSAYMNCSYKTEIHNEDKKKQQALNFLNFFFITVQMHSESKSFLLSSIITLD